MQYRNLGKTGMNVSCVGLGGGMLGSSKTDHAVQIVERALELGVNYFDTARSYPDSEVILGMGLKGRRDSVYVSSKTGATTRDEAWQHIYESLERLQTGYLDNYHLHALQNEEDLNARVGRGGALEALVEAKGQGLIRHIGCTSHASRWLLVEALKRYDFEIILVPMNIVEREPLDGLIPLCLEKGVGVTIMKPLATGLLPAPLALKWLMNQPIATAVPGASTVEEVTANSLVGHLQDVALTGEEAAEVARYAGTLDHVRCRLCKACEPCHAGIAIAGTLGTDVIYDHYRTMGAQAFSSFPWSRQRVRGDYASRRELIRQIESCDDCGSCEGNCPYGLPVVSMLKSMVLPMKDIVRTWDLIISGG
jgi:aryl-alcohol dehydrogenase-like predicted oxidoreductase